MKALPTRPSPVPACELCRRPFEEGDIVNVDITVFINGMHGDLNETFFVGTVSEEKKKLVQGAYFCLMEAIKHVRCPRKP